MPEQESSCRRLMNKNPYPRKCAPCFESPPISERCQAYKVVPPPEGAVEPLADVIQAVIEPEITEPQITEPEGPVRRVIDIHAECSKPRPLFGSELDKMRCCTICVAQNQNISPNLCSAACRPLKTLMHTEEWTKRPLPKPTYKNMVLLDATTMAGRCFPSRFRLRREKNKCLECGRPLYLRHPITNNTDLLLLQNCCTVEVYPMKKVENMNNVKVTKITGVKKFANSLLKERSECRLFALSAAKPAAAKPATAVVDPGSSAPRKSGRRSTKSGRKSKKG